MAKKKVAKKTKKPDEERTTYPVKISKIKENDIMAFVYYARVCRVRTNVLDVHNIDADMSFFVEGRSLIERGLSADQYEKEVKVTKSRAAEILISSYNCPLTVCFEKLDGNERVLRGRLVKPEPLLGRSMVEDLDISAPESKKESRYRLVDHRTIRYLIVNGVKYQVK